LSREAIVFGGWFSLATTTLKFPGVVPIAATTGVIGLFCSVMIYSDTHRRFWRFAQTAPRFLGSALILAAAGLFAFGLAIKASLLVLATVSVIKLACDARVMLPLDQADEEDPLTAELHTARLLNGPLRSLFGGRIAMAVTAAFVLPALILTDKLPPPTSWLVFASVLLGELVERHLFFRAVDAPKMPGVAA
jgi:DMSO reductase anchor subunit